jgi:hypothetical protein
MEDFAAVVLTELNYRKTLITMESVTPATLMLTTTEF